MGTTGLCCRLFRSEAVLYFFYLHSRYLVTCTSSGAELPKSGRDSISPTPAARGPNSVAPIGDGARRVWPPEELDRHNGRFQKQM